ncbi:Hint domain-containing protein, partial [Candidatus Magnetobacterium casense]
MARANRPEDTTEVRRVPARKGVLVGKPSKIVTSAMRIKTAFPTTTGTYLGQGGNFYSPELSTDFLELPQSVDEQRNYYRFFYDNDPFVGQAIDLHSELPLSKLRLGLPEVKDRDMAEKSLRFCQRWAKKIGLLHRLLEIVHEYFLIGEVFIFAEDTSPDMPQDIRAKCIREITVEGEAIERWEDYPDADERAVAWLKKNYKGWSAIRVLPPEQMHMESFPFTDEKLIELVVDSKTKAIYQRAQTGDPAAVRIAASMPETVLQAIQQGRNIPLNTDPDAGSFLYYLARKKSQYEPRGKSILQRCLLPGTPIWIKRGGVVQRMPVEMVNDQTDLLLTHKGRFRPCKAGSRLVNEEVAVIDIEGVEKPLRLTADHEVLMVREDGTEEWIAAGQLQPRDLVREGHVVSESSDWPRWIDLAAWWKGRTLMTAKRGRPTLGLKESVRTIEVTDVTVKSNPGLVVSFAHENDNRNRARALSGL